jgi:hypothetical protein
MGIVNESLIMSHHTSFQHAQQLSGLLMSVAARPTPRRDGGHELARLARMQWHADWRSHELAREVDSLRSELRQQEHRADAAERSAEQLAATLRWRTAQRALAPLDAMRARLRNGRS